MLSLVQFYCKNFAICCLHRTDSQPKNNCTYFSVGEGMCYGANVDLDMFARRESWEMIESSHILYRESVL
jgi:hypothetical protein